MFSFRLARGLAAFASIVLMSSLALADPPNAPRSLTLARALVLARENNQVVAAARARIGEARGVLTTQSVLLVDNPELSFEIGPRRSPGAGGTSLDLGVGLEQSLELGGQRGRRRAVARAQLGAAEANAEDVQRVVDLAVAQAFYAALAARLSLGVHSSEHDVFVSLAPVGHADGEIGHRLGSGEPRSLTRSVHTQRGREHVRATPERAALESHERWSRLRHGELSLERQLRVDS